MKTKSTFSSPATTALFAFFLAGTTLFAQSPPWEMTNGPRGGIYSALAISGEGEIYLSTLRGGVSRSSDNGENWELTGLLASTIPVLGVNLNGDIYASYTAPPNHAYPERLLRSADHGETWTDTDLPCMTIFDLAFNSQGHIFVSDWFDEKIFRSTDNGNTWTTVDLTGKPIRSLALNQSDVLFVMTGQNGIYRSADNGLSWEYAGKPAGFVGDLLVSGDGYLYAGTDIGLYRSTNNGQTWQVVPQFTNKSSSTVGAGNGCVFARTHEVNFIYRSSDGGASWEEIDFSDFHPPRKFAFNAIGHIFTVAQNTVLRSLNNGNTWTEIQAGVVNSSPSSLAANNSRLLAVAYDGISVSTDQGETWNHSRNFLEQTGFTPFKMAVNDAGHIFVTGWHIIPEGLFISMDEGENWSLLDVPYYAMAPFINETGHLFIGGGDGQVWHSLNNGDAWSPIGPGTNSHLSAVAAGVNGAIFAGTKKGSVFRTLNHGLDWSESLLADTSITVLAYDGQGLILAGTASGQIFRSGDQGETWDQTASLPSAVQDILLKNPDEIAVATKWHGVYASANSGYTWFPFNNGLLNPSIAALAMDDDGVLYAGTGGNGVFRTTSYISSIRSPQLEIPDFALGQSYPNPFHTHANIPFSIRSRTRIRLDILDMHGRLIHAILDEILPPGDYAAVWDGAGMPAGVYFYRLKTEWGVAARKCVLQQ